MTALAGQFTSHLQELRRRVTSSFLAIILATVLAYSFVEDLVHLLMRPLREGHPDLARLVYTRLTEAFVAYLKVALLTGLAAALPICCYQLWCFIAPGLHRNEKKLARELLFWGSILFLGGVIFAYLVALPKLLSFLLGFAGEWLTPLLKIDAYLTFIARTALAFGLAFEIPFLMLMASRSGLVSRGYFSRQRKYAYLAILVLAFLLAVGDILSTLLLALPLFLLYESGILLGRLFRGKAGEAQPPANSSRTSIP